MARICLFSLLKLKDVANKKGVWVHINALGVLAPLCSSANWEDSHWEAVERCLVFIDAGGALPDWRGSGPAAPRRNGQAEGSLTDQLLNYRSVAVERLSRDLWWRSGCLRFRRSLTCYMLLSICSHNRRLKKANELQVIRIFPLVCLHVFRKLLVPLLYIDLYILYF